MIITTVLASLASLEAASSSSAEAASSRVASSNATLTARSGAAPTALIDSPAPAGGASLGSSWTTSGAGDWVRFTWPYATSITSVQLYGSVSPAQIASSTLRFSDNSSVRLGALLGDGAHPTTLAFPARSVTWVQLTVDKVSGTGTAGIAEFGVFGAGTTPPKNNVPTTPGGIGVAVSSQPACSSPAPSGLAIICPAPFTVVDGQTTLTVSAPGATRVEARIWSTSASTSAAVSGDVRSGRAELGFVSSLMPYGPFTVEVRSYSGTRLVAGPKYLQLVNGTGARRLAPGAATTSAAASGLTLAYAEEFTSNVSFSRSGAGADYASGKPEWYGAQEFGEGIFADPSSGFDNLTVVDDDYLRITATNAPAGYADPMKWNRTHIGGMLSSARPGGSGFSAQYGYFETRMALPAADGTWPAFWFLPSTNLISAIDPVAEIDGLEAYGHNPLFNCQATHEYVGTWPARTDTAKVECSPNKYTTVQQGLEWHTYGTRITPTWNIFYVDGVEVERLPQVKGGDQPMFFMANMALGGQYNIDLSTASGAAAMYVDYIRVYS